MVSPALGCMHAWRIRRQGKEKEGRGRQKMKTSSWHTRTDCTSRCDEGKEIRCERCCYHKSFRYWFIGRAKPNIPFYYKYNCYCKFLSYCYFLRIKEFKPGPLWIYCRFIHAKLIFIFVPTPPSDVKPKIICHTDTPSHRVNTSLSQPSMFQSNAHLCVFHPYEREDEWENENRASGYTNRSLRASKTLNLASFSLSLSWLTLFIDVSSFPSLGSKINDA